jgi:hypothetical protein
MEIGKKLSKWIKSRKNGKMQQFLIIPMSQHSNISDFHHSSLPTFQL